MDSRMFDGVISALVIFGAALGVAGTLVCVYVLPYFWHHIHWVN